VRCSDVVVDKPQVYHGFIRAGARRSQQQHLDYPEYPEVKTVNFYQIRFNAVEKLK